MKNHLWNMFANIKNGQLAKRSEITQTKTKACIAFLKILWNEGFISGYSMDSQQKNILKIFLIYKNNKPVINKITVLSKPSRKIYYSIKQIWKIDSNESFIIFSTNLGLKSINDCKKLKLGGEPIILIK